MRFNSEFKGLRRVQPVKNGNVKLENIEPFKGITVVYMKEHG
jgi:hypothetical protein